MPQEQTSSFIPVGALGEAFRSDAYILPQVHDLDGHELPWEIDGARGVLQLGSDGTAEWEGGRRVPVRVSSIRPDIYLVDGVVTPASAGTGCVTRSVSWVVDLSKPGVFTGIGIRATRVACRDVEGALTWENTSC